MRRHIARFAVIALLAVVASASLAGCCHEGQSDIGFLDLTTPDIVRAGDPVDITFHYYVCPGENELLPGAVTAPDDTTFLLHPQVRFPDCGGPLIGAPCGPVEGLVRVAQAPAKDFRLIIVGYSGAVTAHVAVGDPGSIERHTIHFDGVAMPAGITIAQVAGSDTLARAVADTVGDAVLTPRCSTSPRPYVLVVTTPNGQFRSEVPFALSPAVCGTSTRTVLRLY